MRDLSPSRTRWWLALILIAALTARLLAGLYVERQVAARNARLPVKAQAPFLFPDSVNMHNMATNLARGLGHRDATGRWAWRMPAYQAFLALLYTVGFESAHSVRAVQAVLDTLNVLLIFLLGMRMFGRRPALYAAGMAAVYPFFVYFSALVLSETLAVTAILGVAYTQRRLLERFCAHRALLAGLVLGAATLVKASFAGLVVAFGLYHFIARARLGWRHCGLVCGVLLVGWAVVLAPWTIRNWVHLDAFVPLSTMGGYTLYESNSAFSDGGPNMGKIVFPPGTGTDDLSEAPRDRALREAALDWIRAHPGQFLRTSLRSFLRTWNVIPNYAQARTWPKILASLLSYVPVMALGLYALWRTRRAWRATWLLVVPVVYVALLHSVFMGSVRYRVPVMTCMILLAARGIQLLRAEERRDELSDRAL